MHTAEVDEMKVLYQYLINLTGPCVVQNNSPTVYEICGLYSTEVLFSRCDLRCLQSTKAIKAIIPPSGSSSKLPLKHI